MIPLGILQECRLYFKYGINKYNLQYELSEDLKIIEDLINTERVVERCLSQEDYSMALNSIEKLSLSCNKSEKIADQKIILLIHNLKLQEALDYSKTFPSFIHWQSKILYYQDRYQDALNLIKSRTDLKETFEMIKNSKELKEQAAELFS